MANSKDKQKAYQGGTLDFVINRYFMELFNTNNIETKVWQEYFSFELPSEQLAKSEIKVNSV